MDVDQGYRGLFTQSYPLYQPYLYLHNRLIPFVPLEELPMLPRTPFYRSQAVHRTNGRFPPIPRWFPDKEQQVFKFDLVRVLPAVTYPLLVFLPAEILQPNQLGFLFYQNQSFPVPMLFVLAI